MIAILRGGQVVALCSTEGEAKEQAEPGDTLEPATFGNDPGRLRLRIDYTLEKFEGDIQSPETLLETIVGEG